MKNKLKKNEIFAFQKGKAMVTKWKDNREFCVLSTLHNDGMVTEEMRGKEIKSLGLFKTTTILSRRRETRLTSR